MKNGTIAVRIIKDKLFTVSIVFLAGVVALPLFLIFFYIFKLGIASINWEFFIHLPKPVGETGGGISNALVGTVILIGIACFVSLPPGIATGVYLSEFPNRKLTYWVRLAAEVVQGVPSIVIGIVAYVWFVKTFGGFSAMSGGIALGIMMLPIIVRATEETLLLVPDTLKEASLALGVPYYRTMLKVIIPAGLSGILTGILLSISRIAGETAPLLFTAFGNPFMSYNLFKPISALPLIIFNYAISPYQDWHALAWGASLILIVMVLSLNIITKLIVRKWKVQF